MSGSADEVEIVDLQFPLRGRAVPADYADLLWQALQAALPWLAEESLAGVHPLHGLSAGGDEWYLSRRSQLILRLPRTRLAEAGALAGARLDLQGLVLDVGEPCEKRLVHTPVLYSHFVTFSETDTPPPDEAAFYQAVVAELAALDLKPHGVLCGKRRQARTAAGLLHGFSLMVTGLDEAQTLRLMKHGLGRERKRGCGIFIPHKSHPADGSH